MNPPPAEDLLHEAFQRLILNQIIETEKDIDLDTVDFRETPELRRADLQKMAVPFRPSVGQCERDSCSLKFLIDFHLASDSPSKSEGRPTKISASIHGETDTSVQFLLHHRLDISATLQSPESDAKMMMKMEATR